MTNTFIKHYIPSFREPQRTFYNIILEASKLKLAFISVSIQAVLYTMVYIFLIYGGGRPYKPWLDIANEVYYRYNVFFCAPSMYLGWILASGVSHLVARIFTNLGSFEEIFCLFGFGIGIASWSTGLHDLVTSFLGAIHVIDQREYEVMLNSATIWRTILWAMMTTYLIWFVILFTKAVKAVYRLNLYLSLSIGSLGFIVYQLFFFIFNR